MIRIDSCFVFCFGDKLIDPPIYVGCYLYCRSELLSERSDRHRYGQRHRGIKRKSPPDLRY